MTSPLLISTLVFLCMLASVAHAAKPVGRWADVVWLAGAFSATFALAVWAGVSPAGAGLVVALTAAWRLVWQGSPQIDLSLAGVCCGVAAGLYASSGVPAWVAGAICLGLTVSAVVLAQDPHFRSARVLDTALLVTAWTAPLLGAAPDITAGWQSARALNQSVEAAAADSIPAWALVFVVLALLAGAARKFWMKR